MRKPPQSLAKLLLPFEWSLQVEQNLELAEDIQDGLKNLGNEDAN